MAQLRRVIFIVALLMMWLNGMAQGIFSTAANIGDKTQIDYVLGESFTADTEPASIGFLPALYHSALSSVKQFTDSAHIQVHFDNNLQQATIFLSYSIARHKPQYIISNTAGVVHLAGEITSAPHFINYNNLPTGIYILHIYGLSGRIPHTTRWLKK